MKVLLDTNVGFQAYSLATALAGNVYAIITRDLLTLEEFAGIIILKPQDFLRIVVDKTGE